MKRMFAFGCSFTGYGWPTWADIVGQSFDYYENWGSSGSGNYLISSRIVECDAVHKITKGDVVLVMFTSIPRIDFYNGNHWSMNGNIFNTHAKQFEQEWRDNNWSVEQGFYNTWMAIKQAKVFLESLGCEYKFMRAFDILSSTLGDTTGLNKYNDGLDNFTTQQKDSSFYKTYDSDISYCFGDEPTMLSWLQENISSPSGYPLYKFKKAGNNTNYTDYHPTVKHHEKWCTEFLSDYYTNKLDPFIIENNIPLEDNALIGSHNFNLKRNYGKFLLG